jgi:hypothetical protein
MLDFTSLNEIIEEYLDFNAISKSSKDKWSNMIIFLGIILRYISNFYFSILIGGPEKPNFKLICNFLKCY